jgi:hypothetical protein
LLSTALFVLAVTVPPALVGGLLGLGRWSVALLTFMIIAFISQHTWQVD